MFLHLSVSLSVHMGGGGCASVHAGIADPLGADIPQAGGTYPTGMHTCSEVCKAVADLNSKI